MARIEKIEHILPIQEAQSVGLKPGDRGYLTFCINWVDKKITQYYRRVGLQPPTTKTVQKWFYADNFPDWAVAFLLNSVQ